MDLKKALDWLRNTVIVGDPWLTDLAARGKEQAKVAQVLLRTQTRLAHNLGHILDYSQEHVRNNISGNARLGKTPSCYIRCLRCGQTAFMKHWVEAATMTKAQREAAIARGMELGIAELQRHMQPCDGEATAIKTDQEIARLMARE
jgi:hypothetical protein